MQDINFDGAVAVVTGSGAGLGKAYALLLASRGAKVVVNDINPENVSEVVSTIRSTGGTAIGCTVAVGTESAAKEIIGSAVEAFGKIDVLINNAGNLRDKSFTKMTADDFTAVYTVHLQGAFFLSQVAYTHMREQNFGRIVFTTSAAGLLGNFGQANYSSVKSAMVGLARTISVEGKKYNIRANVISPGAATAMTAGVQGSDIDMKPESVAPVVAWLCHADCDLKGQILHAMGGRVACDFIAETQGVFLGDEISIETVSKNMDQILNRDNYFVPQNLTDTIAVLFKMIENTKL